MRKHLSSWKIQILAFLIVALGILGGVGLYAHSNLSADRNTPMKGMDVASWKMATTTIYKGALVCVTTSTGYVSACADSAGVIVVGVADEQVVNAGSAGTKTIRVLSNGTFKFNNSVDHAIGQSNVGGLCYVDNDDRVGSTGTNTIVAGVVQTYDTTGVWVIIPSEAWRTSLSAVYAVASESFYVSGAIGADTTAPLFVAYKAGTIVQAVIDCDVQGADTNSHPDITANVLIGSTTIYTTAPELGHGATTVCPCSSYASGTGVVVGVISTAADDFTAGQKIYATFDISTAANITNQFSDCVISVWYKQLVQ